MPSIEECFAAQHGPLTCVAACLAIIRRWRGERIDEAAVRQAWGDPPYALAVHAAADGTYVPTDPDAPSSLEYLRAHLKDGWVVITLQLAPRRPAHAVILVGINSTGALQYLDPADPADKQPFAMSEAELVKAWTGQLLIARRPPT